MHQPQTTVHLIIFHLANFVATVYLNRTQRSSLQISVQHQQSVPTCLGYKLQNAKLEQPTHFARDLFIRCTNYPDKVHENLRVEPFLLHNRMCHGIGVRRPVLEVASFAIAPIKRPQELINRLTTLKYNNKMNCTLYFGQTIKLSTITLIVSRGWPATTVHIPPKPPERKYLIGLLFSDIFFQLALIRFIV